MKDANPYSIKNSPDLTDTKTRLKIKRAFSSERGFLFFERVPYDEDYAWLSDEEVRVLREFGATVERVAIKCDCGYCTECDTRRLNALSEEEKIKLEALEERHLKIREEVSQMSEEAQSVWHSRTSMTPYA